MTKEEMAARLDGREYPFDLSAAEESDAKAAGLVVLFGASDDLAEFRGAINDEAGCYDGGELLILGDKLYQDEEECDCSHAMAARRIAMESSLHIEAVWCGPSGYDWAYETEIPHATFDVLEDGRKYCRGIVFEVPA